VFGWKTYPFDETRSATSLMAKHSGGSHDERGQGRDAETFTAILGASFDTRSPYRADTGRPNAIISGRK
jgi:hypothetical protein